MITRTILFGCLVLATSPAQAEAFVCGDENALPLEVVKGGRWEKFQLVGSPQLYGLSGLHIIEAKRPEGMLRVHIVSSKADRYGRKLVQAYRREVWVQGDLLRQGKALVYGLGLRGKCLEAMQQAENLAEQSKAGIWANNALPINATQLDLLTAKTGHFSLIEGKVISVGDRPRRLYLNFGQKWSQDFTVSIAKKGKGAFKGDINRLINSKDKTVRVRGILENRQGPLIRLFDEAQITIID